MIVAHQAKADSTSFASPPMSAAERSCASAAMPGYCELPGFGPALLLTSLTDVQALCWGS